MKKMTSQNTISNSSETGSSLSLPEYSIGMSLSVEPRGAGEQQQQQQRAAFEQTSQEIRLEAIGNICSTECGPRNDDQPGPDDCWSRLTKYCTDFVRQHKRFFLFICFVLYNVFFVFAISRSWNKTPDWGSGVKLLTALTCVAYTCLLYKHLIKKQLHHLQKSLYASGRCIELSDVHRRTIRILIWVLVLAGISGFVISIAWKDPIRFRSAGGYIAFVAIVYLFSKHKRHINWSQILWGLTLQILFGMFVLRTTIGKQIFDTIGTKINTFLKFTEAGTSLVFGYVATGHLLGPKGNASAVIQESNQTVVLEFADSLPMPVQATIFAFSAMPVVIFFSFFVGILYYYGIMQAVVKQLGWLLQATIGTTACESISASGNIFLGMSESPLLVRPFLPIMTKSELHAVLTGGFATIAGSVMAAYISFGISASHLLSASVMAAPSALAMSKLMYPETEKSQTTAKDIKLDKGHERNVIEAGSNGASAAIGLVSNIIANLIAFMAFLAFLDSILGWIGEMIDAPQVSFKFLLSKLLLPVALMLGVEWEDAENVASLVGLKMVVNEFVAYQNLSELIRDGELKQRSATIATFALCSFANFSSIGIQVGGLSSMAPNRKSDLAELALRAMLTGTACSFLTACVAGTLYE